MTLVIDRVTIGHVNRSWRRPVKTGPVMDALDEASRALKDAEELFDERRRALIKAMVAAKVDAGASITEIADRTGYSREHASKLIAEHIGHARNEA